MSVATRARDVAAAVAGLVATLPLCAWLAWRVRREDGGPALYRQQRVGRGGRLFTLYKFRTMAVGPASGGALVTVAGDSRVTRLGAWLRQTKLDELPQLWNVLRGDMTLVGPRPEVPAFVARYSDAERAVLALTPGLTDPASLEYIDEEALLARYADPVAGYVTDVMPAKIRRNLAYATRASARTDARMLYLTVRAVGSRILRTRQHAAAASRRAERRRAGVLRHRRVAIACAYAVLVPIAYAAAFLLRSDFRVDAHSARVFRDTLGLLVAARLLAHWRLGVFRGYWQHFGFRDLVAIVRSVSGGTLLFAAALTFVPALGGSAAVPWGVLGVEWTLAILTAAGAHGAARLGREWWVARRATRVRRRTLLLGAGEAAERVLRQFQHDPRLGVHVVGLLDDDPAKFGRVLHGVPVIGPAVAVRELAARHGAELLVLAMPSAAWDAQRRLAVACTTLGVEFRIVRPLGELVDGTAAEPLRAVSAEELLGRPPVRFASPAFAEHVAGRVVLVTGGAGSIGSEIARQVAALGPRRLVLFDQAESPLYYTRLELLHDHPDVPVVPITGTVTDESHLARVFAAHRPDVVFHAAAYKHVPMMEENVAAAVRTNVFGTLNVARCAVAGHAAVFVLLSTDKAVNPSSVMGATKRVAERLVLAWPEFRAAATEFRAVRFGNVLGSDGSVVPLFRRQLQRGGPITVTHPEVERYFMTVQEAVQLVLQSVALPGGAGRIAMLDMGAPVRIVHLAETLVRLSGREPYTDVPIVFTGMRPGEKLREELVAAFENAWPTPVDKIRVVATVEAPGPLTPGALAELKVAARGGEDVRALRILCALVPECVGELRARVAADRAAEVPPAVRVPRDLSFALPGAFAAAEPDRIPPVA